MRVRNLVVCALCLLCANPALAQKPASAGAYRDRTGAQHAWTIGAGHALTWDGKPYIPVGGTFMPRALALGATEENWAADIKALDALKAKGVLDLIIDPVVSATDISPAVWQRLIDTLEAGGFRYGIAFGQGVKTPLSGIVVRPQVYRIAGVRDNSDVVWDVDDADNARYVVADATDGTRILKEGQVRVRDGTATAAVGATAPGGAVALLYPHKFLSPSRSGWMPDLWAGFDVYRDRLLALFSQVKFGAGLRFFLDPLARPLGLLGDGEYLIPDSPGFRMEWEAYLRRRYPSPDAVQQAWCITLSDVKSYRPLTTLVPLWESRSGVPFMLDYVTGRRYQLGSGAPRFWDDLREFEAQSFSYYMNAAADVLKREVADVPVVYTRTVQHRMFSQTSAADGFDGLGIAAYGKGSSLVTGGADSVYSQCDDAARMLWCLVVETMDTNSPKKTAPGYASRDALFFDLDWLRGIGARGFYVWGLQILPVEKYAAYQLAAMPEQLEWLKAYGDRSMGSGLAASHPRTVPFPMCAAGIVQAGPIGNTGIAWVPSLAPGRLLVFGSSYAGYAIQHDDSEMTVLWSLRGARETHLHIADPSRLQVTTIDGTPVPVRVDVKRKIAVLVFEDTPFILQTHGMDFVPLEYLEDTTKQLRNMVAHALQDGVPALDYRYTVDRVERAMKAKNYLLAGTLLQEGIVGLTSLAQPYTWREGENPDAHTFTEVARIPGASNGAALVLDAASRTQAEGFTASYKFTAPADGDYTVWIACTPPGPQASPFSWTMDGGSAKLSSEGAVVGAPYDGDQFVWMNLGHAPISKGVHTFALRVRDVAPALDRYALAVDAIVITRNPFTPRGILRPVLPEDVVKLPGLDRRKLR